MKTVLFDSTTISVQQILRKSQPAWNQLRRHHLTTRWLVLNIIRITPQIITQINTCNSMSFWQRLDHLFSLDWMAWQMDCRMHSTMHWTTTTTMEFEQRFCLELRDEELEEEVLETKEGRVQEIDWTTGRTHRKQCLLPCSSFWSYPYSYGFSKNRLVNPKHEQMTPKKCDLSIPAMNGPSFFLPVFLYIPHPSSLHVPLKYRTDIGHCIHVEVNDLLII